MQKKYVPLLLFFALLLVFAAHLGARLALSEPAFSLACAQEKRVYLTFDDGPSTVVTNSILDTLRREQIRATFFIVSDRVAGREETLGRIAREGHTLGVHSATHRYEEIYASDEALLADAETCAGVIRRVPGVTPHLYRFPGGGWDAARRSVLLEKKGYRVVRWNAECGDATAGATADELVETAIETSRGKNTVVLLMHDSAYRKTTAEALPRIIEYFRGQGYAFCAY